MSIRFTPVLIELSHGTATMAASSAVAASFASATLTTETVRATPSRHLVWVYNLHGTKVDVLA